MLIIFGKGKKCQMIWGAMALFLAVVGCGGLSGDGGGGGGAAGPEVTVTPNSAMISENGGTEAFSVGLTTAPNGNVVIQLKSSDTGEAAVEPSQLTFNQQNWTKPQVVNVTGVNDDFVDGNNTVDITLEINAQLTNDSSGYASLSATPLAALKVTVTDDDTVGVAVSPNTLNISEGGPNNTAKINVVLNTRPDANVGISVSSSNPGKAGATPASLVFTPDNWATTQTITVSGVDNATVDGNTSMQVFLDVDAAATLDTSGYRELAPSAVRDVTVNVIDDDKEGVIVSPTLLQVFENGSTVEFTVKLATQPNGAVAIDVVSSDTGQATVNTGRLTFTPQDWGAPKVVRVSAVLDFYGDGNKRIPIRVDVNQGATLDTSGYLTLRPEDVADVSVDVIDTDVSGVYVNPVNLQVYENGVSVFFDVRLNTRPGGQVAISVASSNAGEVLVNKAGGALGGSTSLVFSPTDWSTSQTVEVKGVADGVNDGNKSVPILVDIDPSGTADLGYKNMTPGAVSDVIVEVINNSF